MSERKKLLAYRICGLVLTILFASLPTIINAATPIPQLTDVDCFTEYNETFEWSDCEIILTFDSSLNDYSGHIDIAFYDINENTYHSVLFIYITIMVKQWPKNLQFLETT